MSRKKPKQKDSSLKVPQRDKIKDELTIFQREDLTDKQREFIELLMDKQTKIVFVNGPAGTSKTFLSVYCGLHLLNKRSVSDILYIRTIIESAGKSLGSLPGEIDDKFGPFMMPLLDKLDELLPKAQVDALVKDERVKAMPVNYLRGASFNAKFILADEAQNFSFQELVTLITRFGEFSKLVIIGDTRQADIGDRSGFPAFCKIFGTERSAEKGIHYFEFDKTDIVRSKLLQFIVEEIENAGEQSTK